MSTIDDIKTALQALSPELIEIEDDSDKHAGHAGNTGGGGRVVREIEGVRGDVQELFCQRSITN